MQFGAQKRQDPCGCCMEIQRLGGQGGQGDLGVQVRDEGGWGHAEVLHPRHRLKVGSTGFLVRLCRGGERVRLALLVVA